MSNNKVDPKMTVVMPVYNGSRFIRQSIESVLHQTMQSFELLIRDDASTDNTVSIIESFDDNRIKLVKAKKNIGIFRSINDLCRMSQAPFIHLWAQDDMMEENCLSECLAFHLGNPEVAFSFSSNYRINEHDEIVREGPDNGKWIVMQPEDSVPLFLAFGCIPSNISSVTLNREIIIQEGLFNNNLKFVGDFEMWVRLSAKYPFGKIASRLVKIRNHQEQASKHPEMLAYKLEESNDVYKMQLNLLDPVYKKAGYNIITKIHHTHFVFVAFNFLKSGNITAFKKYLKVLTQLNGTFSLIINSVVYGICKGIGQEKNYRQIFYRPFKTHIKKFF
jgi:glycosyltransferase involved in cell wall biosynthesis